MPHTISESPLLVRPPSKLQTFTVQQAARFVARPREDIEKVENRYRNLLNRRLIHFDLVNGRIILRIEDVAASEVIVNTFLIGGGNNASVTHAVSLACYAWHAEYNPKSATIRQKGISPIIAAMVGANDGESWALRLAVFYYEAAGQRQIFAALHNTDIELPDLAGTLAPSYSPEFDVMMQITRSMLRFGDLLRGATLSP
jgi:hypothetical protein